MLIRVRQLVAAVILLVGATPQCRAEDAFTLQPVKHQVEILQTVVNLRTMLSFKSVSVGKNVVVDAKIVTDISDFEKKLTIFLQRAMTHGKLTIRRDFADIDVVIDKIKLIDKNNRLSARIFGSFKNIKIINITSLDFEKSFEMYVPLDFALNASGNIDFVAGRPSIVFKGAIEKIGAYLGFITGNDYTKMAEDMIADELKKIPSLPIPAMQKMSPRLTGYRVYREKGILMIEIQGGIEVSSAMVDPLFTAMLTSFNPRPKNAPAVSVTPATFTPSNVRIRP